MVITFLLAIFQLILTEMCTFPIDDHLVVLIDRLNTAINVCYEAIDEKDKGYPFATGYSRSAMMSVADDLSKIVKEMRDEADS